MQTFNKRLLVSISCSLLLIASNMAAADKTGTKALTETWYQIEVLIYEPIKQTIAGEAWPAISNEELPAAMVELTPISESSTISNTQINAFSQLAPETLVLAETANKLTASRRYRIITFQGWQQPVKQRHEAESVHLTSKQLTEPLTTETNAAILNPPQDIDNNIAEPLYDEAGLLIEDEPAKIDGTVTVSLSRYLHMALNLRYHNPDVYLAEQIALQKPEEVIIENFMMTQSRRMRSKEVHVFDHPYFGVIAVITPVERIINP